MNARMRSAGASASPMPVRPASSVSRTTTVSAAPSQSSALTAGVTMGMTSRSTIADADDSLNSAPCRGPSVVGLEEGDHLADGNVGARSLRDLDERAGGERLHLDVRLVGLDLDDHLAALDPVADLRRPGHDVPRLHAVAQVGHRDRDPQSVHPHPFQQLLVEVDAEAGPRRDAQAAVAELEGLGEETADEGGSGYGVFRPSLGARAQRRTGARPRRARRSRSSAAPPRSRTRARDLRS